MRKKIIGIVGFKGSGKDTAANCLCNNYNFERDSFAKPVKDACASIFGWDRDMLEGDTNYSREQRELLDNYWTVVLDREWSPRIAFQQFGTEIMRNNLHKDIWVQSLLLRIQRAQYNIVVTDCRFKNEIDMLKNIGAKIIRVKRGEDPNEEEIAKLHESERDWIGSDIDEIIYNDGNIQELNYNIIQFMERQ